MRRGDGPGIDSGQSQLELPLPDPTRAPAPPPARPPVRGTWRHTMLAGYPCRFQLRRARRRTIGFQIDDNGLTVSAPRWVSLKDIESAIEEKQRWIRAKLDEWSVLRQRRPGPSMRWRDGGSLPYLGRQLTIRLGAAAGAAFGADRKAIAATFASDGELRLALDPASGEERIRAAVQEWMKDEARRILGERIELLAQRGGVRPLAWRLSSARTRWGSCNEDGRIWLNWRLLFYPIEVIDYVVAHELAHLAELNHGPRFWREVGRLLPGFESAKARIKDEELACLPL
jgi:predicted metal-dependent hydrolase